MRLLVKLGGTLLDKSTTRVSLAAQLATAARTHEVVVVHGGGKQMTRYLAEHGIESRFENGLRVTTPPVLDAVLKVFAGTVNKQLVAALIAAGAPAVGLTGVDAALAEAEPMDAKLGAVGRIVRTNAVVLLTLVESGFLPVVACVAGDRQGNIYNVNADQMAAGLASSFRADALYFLTDVDGVMGKERNVLRCLAAAEARELIASGIASGGMLAKLTYALEALAGGVREVRIAQGSTPDVLARLAGGEDLGTRLVQGDN